MWLKLVHKTHHHQPHMSAQTIQSTWIKGCQNSSTKVSWKLLKAKFCARYIIYSVYRFVQTKFIITNSRIDAMVRWVRSKKVSNAVCVCFIILSQVFDGRHLLCNSHFKIVGLQLVGKLCSYCRVLMPTYNLSCRNVNFRAFCWFLCSWAYWILRLFMCRCVYP